MEINTKELLENIVKIMPGIDKGNSLIEGADTVVFNMSQIHSFNDSLSVTVQYHTGLDGAIKANELFKLLKKIKTETIEISQEEDHFLIKAGKTKAKLKLINTDIIDRIKQIVQIPYTDLPNNFMEALDSIFISDNAGQYGGIILHKNIMLTTDVVRLNFYRLSSEIEDMWIPQKNILEILKTKMNLKKYVISEKENRWIHFQTENNVIISSVLQDFTLFPIDDVLGAKVQCENAELILKGEFPSDFPEIIDRCSVLSDITESLNKNYITLIMSSDKLKVLGQRDYGEIEEEIDWVSEVKEPIKCSYIVDFLIKACKKDRNFTLRNFNESNVLLFRTDNYTKIISGMVE